MSLPRVASVLALVSLAIGPLVGCSGGAGDPAPAGKPGTDAGTDGAPADTGVTTDPVADPAADPVPAGLPTLAARASDSDVAPDLSCFGQPLPVGSGAAVEREVHIVDLGGTDADRVAGATAELYFDNLIKGKADLVGTGASGEDKAQAGVFKASIPNGFIAIHFPKTDGHIETSAYDVDTRPDGFISATVAPQSTVDALSGLIAASPSYKAQPGAGRLVVRAVDCADHPLANAHVTIEVDGVVPAMVTGDAAGIRKSYFGDNELPGPSKWTTRSGVVAFLDVPNAKKLQIVVRGKPDATGDIKVIGIRKLPLVADGVVTAKITPYVAP